MATAMVPWARKPCSLAACSSDALVIELADPQTPSQKNCSMPVVLGLQGLAVHATHGCVVGRRDLRPFPRVPPSDDVSVFHFGGPRAAVRTRSSSTTLNLDGFHIHSRVRTCSLHSPRSLTRGAPMHRSFGSARRARGASRCAAMRSARTRCGATTRREVTTGNIVTPDNPSLVDRVLQTFATPASSLNEGIATFYDESSGLWEDVCAHPSRHCSGRRNPSESKRWRPSVV
jgi:hypothetical protein